jgi:sugar lactone lactonase YvrE
MELSGRLTTGRCITSIHLLKKYQPGITIMKPVRSVILRTAIEVPEEMGYPDGMTIDAEGNVWIALWNGSAVGCWNPETGELIRTIDVPAKNVTSCAFGDKDLGTLYITTARQGTSEEELKNFLRQEGFLKQARCERRGSILF